MKIRIEFDESLTEDEVIIRCRQLDRNIQKIQKSVLDITSVIPRITFFKQDKEYFLPLERILFFESAENNIEAHTADDVYYVKYKLYELEGMLSKKFVRISKSTIINIDHVFSINRNLASSNLIQFHKSHKQVYASRFYFKELKSRLDLIKKFEK